MSIEDQDSVSSTKPVIHGRDTIHGLHRLKSLLKQMPVKVFHSRVDAKDRRLGRHHPHRIIWIKHDLFQPHVVTKCLVADSPAHEVFQRRCLLIHRTSADAWIGFPKAVWVRQFDDPLLIGLHHHGMLISRQPAAHFKQPTTPFLATGRRGEEVLLPGPLDEALALAISLMLTFSPCQLRRKMTSCSGQESGG